MARPLASWTWLWSAVDWLGDVTAIPESWVHSLVSVLWGWGTRERPDFSNIEVKFLEPNPPSLYMNGPLFIRVAFPFYVGVMIRWSASSSRRAFLQTHIGWKLNGRLALAFRVQSDLSAAEGMDFFNYGQASGFSYGTK